MATQGFFVADMFLYLLPFDPDPMFIRESID